MIGLDTNVLARLFVDDDLAQAELARGRKIRKHFRCNEFRPRGPDGHYRRKAREFAPFADYIIDVKNLCGLYPLTRGRNPWLLDEARGASQPLR